MDGLYSWSWVTRQVTRTIEAWNACARHPALHAPSFTPTEQQKHEAAYDEALRAVEHEAKRSPRTPAERLRAQRRIVAVFPRFASVALGLDDDAIQLLTDDFLPVGTNVARWASRFDPTLNVPDIVQACRNAWTACGMQPLLGDRLRITPSILGYSLLYPYSDNHIDHPRVSTEEKLCFSDRFRRRLRGLPLVPVNHHEAAAWAMVELIEDEHHRAQYPQVYASLLAIHRAQEDSIAQLGSCTSISDHELLRLSCAKGGTSVLADACLSHGSLTRQESRFAFDWGVLLQLGDDLQDLHDDLKNGSITLFTRAAVAGTPLDSLVLQLLAFSDRVAAQMDCLPNGDAFLKHLLRMSWRSLIYMAVANVPEFFTQDFLAEVELCSQFRFAFLRTKRKRFYGRRGLYNTIFDAFMQAGDVDSRYLPAPECWKQRTMEPTTETFNSSAARTSLLVNVH
jgi:hypothetical protein